MNTQKLKNFIRKKKCTLLGVGPMSINCVDASIELANYYDFPLFLIASRRQVDSEEFGGGYVNNWTTREFANYVLLKDKNKKIILSRDHGGPWQNSKEIRENMNLKEAMESSKISFKEDITNGFKVIHIDPSIDPWGTPNVDEILERVFELYSFCWEESCRLGKEIIFEIGTEEQSGGNNTQEELEYILQSMKIFCSKNRFTFPTFVVIQSGTKVKEMRNVGSFDSPVRVVDQLASEIQIPKMIEICNKYGILMKEHNADYLSDDALLWHPRLDIHAANVAPEFGVIETIALVKILEDNNLKSLSEKFLNLAYNSRKWEKWITFNSSLTDRGKAILAGHYVFSTQEFLDLKEKACELLISNNLNLDNQLKEAVKFSIKRYLVNFRLI